MSVERFLLFWSHHNQTIIQVLIVLTLIFIVALVFLTLFGAKEESFEKTSNGNINITPDLEKSLQKMLENQTQAKSAVFDFSKGPAATDFAAASTSSNLTAPSTEALAQLEKTKAEMVEREKTIHDLKNQLEQMQSEKQKNQGSTNGSGLEARIKELEARLAEYDIISEDIADLSRFKEENEKLKKQISQMSAAPTPAPAPAPQPSPAPAVAAPVAAVAPTPPPIVEPPSAELTPVPTPVPVAEPSSEVSAAIDDDLMKEFAAAVENQKSTTAAAPAPPPPPSAENEDLMGQFENFVQKKEGT